MQTLYIIRHGQTDWNSTGRLQGHSDIPLNDIGREQARSLIKAVADISPSIIHSSDLQRALQTAEVISNQQFPIQTSIALREAHLGKAEGLTRDEIKKAYGEEFWMKWLSTAPETQSHCFPGGETKADVLARIKGFILGTAESIDMKNIVFVSHGLASRLLVHDSRPDLKEPFYIPNCALLKFRVDLNTKQIIFDNPLIHLQPKT